MALRAQRIRIFANRQTKRVRIDVLTDDTPHLLKPSNLQVELALFDDEGETLSTDLDDLDQISLTIKEGNPRTGDILMQKTVAAADLNLPLTLEEWNGGEPDDCHALFEFSAAETNLSLGADKEVTYYLVLSGLSISIPVKELSIANGVIQIEESGVNDDPPPEITEAGFYTKEQSDARYLLATQNTAVYFTDGDPLGFVTAQRPALAYDAAGNLWIKTNSGSNSAGWEQRLGSAAATATTYEFVSPGTEQLSFITGNPNGAQTATRPALAYDAAGAIWVKTGAGTTNTGWEQRL
jgi:hypothetical protein